MLPQFVLLEGRHREAFVVAGRSAAPASLDATRHSGGGGAPSGTTKSPCQELADGMVCATGFLLERVSAAAADLRRTPNEKRGPASEGRNVMCSSRAIASLLERAAARREAPAAAVLSGRGHHRFASFGAPLPFLRDGHSVLLRMRGDRSLTCPRVATRRGDES